MTNDRRFCPTEHASRPAVPGLEAARLAFIRARFPARVAAVPTTQGADTVTVPTVHHPLDVTTGICPAHMLANGDDTVRTVFFQDGEWHCAEHAPRPGDVPAMLAAHQGPPARTQYIALPTLLETPAELTRRARSLIPSARVCAVVGGHRLGRWAKAQTGHRDVRHYSATCTPCGRSAYVTASRGVNEYGGDAVLFRCAAIPQNRCELTGVEPIRRDAAGAILTCTLPYVAVWTYRNTLGQDSGALRACSEHARTYRRIAAAVPAFGWHQVSGPTDY